MKLTKRYWITMPDYSRSILWYLSRCKEYTAYMPTIASGAKSIAFGDFSHYWIADRQGRSFKRLNELYAVNGQVGFMATERVDGS